MPLNEQQAYSAANQLLEKLIEKQLLLLPSTRAGLTADGAKDAKYIKDLVTGLADFYKNMPGY
jgi:hypothetical protein